MSVQLKDSILDSIQIAEGGYWNDPIGGPTNFGITQSTLDSVRSRSDVTLPETVADLDKDTARVILEREYLYKTRVLELPYPLNLFHAHMVVLSWDDGIRIMQERLGVKADGIIGMITLAAARNQSSIEMLYGIFADLDQFLETRTNGFRDSYTRRFNAINI